MKQKFNIITSTCIPLPLENVDTDQIIPARFLKATDKEGMGDNLFRDWRYNADGTPKKTSFLMTLLIVVSFLWLVRTSVQASLVSTQHGPLRDMVSAW